MATRKSDIWAQKEVCIMNMIEDPSFDVFNISSGLNSNVCFIFFVFTFYQLKSRCWIDNCNDVVFDSFLTYNALYKVLFMKDDV